MPKTNYDVIMEKMDVQILAMLLAINDVYNPCSHCVHQLEFECRRDCFNGILEWLMLDVENLSND